MAKSMKLLDDKAGEERGRRNQLYADAEKKKISDVGTKEEESTRREPRYQPRHSQGNGCGKRKRLNIEARMIISRKSV